MDEQQLQQQIVQLVQAAMQGDQQATQQIQQIMQAAQQGDQQAVQIAQLIQQVAQQMQQQQVRAARFGAKLNYIRQLKGTCPEGYKIEYYQQGGQLCKRCMKVQQNGGEVEQTPNTVAGQFKMESAKSGKKIKTIESEKCGGKPKLKKKANGGSMKKYQGGKNVTLKKETRKGDDEEETRTRTWSDGTTSKMETSEGGTVYTGRKGEVGITNVPNAKQNAVADSLRRVDWSKKTAPQLKSKTRK